MAKLGSQRWDRFAICLNGPLSRELDMDQISTNQDDSSALSSLNDVQLDVMERKIATKYMQIVPWGAVVWGLGNCLMFIALFPLVLMDIMPLWIAFPIATLNCALAYLPSHEAQHNIIGGPGQRLRWLNECVGHISPIPLVLPYRILRATHMVHHQHCNDPELDPDYDVHARSNIDFFVQYLKNIQPDGGRNNAYGSCLERLGRTDLMLDSAVSEGIYLTVLLAMAWSGHAIEAALLWWLPKLIAGAHLQYYLSWAPHRPGREQGRYRDTRAFKSQLGNIFSAGMQYHIIHHLYPRIPLSLTPAAYRELKPILAQRGCELGNR
jgi:beta-carotene hydroxylase